MALGSKKNTVLFDDLPVGVRTQVEEILSHRKDIRMQTKHAAISTAVVAAIAFAVGSKVVPGQKLKVGLLFAGSSSMSAGLISAVSLLGHNVVFKKEALDLYNALDTTKETSPVLRNLLEHYPYVIVNRRGDLVGKRVAARVLWFPIGRRRIVSPFVTKKTALRWAKGYFPKTKRTRKRKPVG